MRGEERQGGLRELARSAGVYGAANAFVSASKFFLIPVYAHYLSAGQYGLLGTTNTLSVLFVMLMGAGIERAVAREYFDHASDEASLARYFRSILGFLLAVNAAVFALLAVAGIVIGGYTQKAFGLPYYPFVPLASAIALATALYSILMVTLQVQQKAYQYIGGQIARFAITICVTLVLLIDFGWGAEGVLVGELAGTSAVALVLLMGRGLRLAGIGKKMLPAADRSPKFAIIKNSLAYALPLVAVEACGWLMSGVDRFVLAGYHGMASVGLYTLAASLSQGMRIFTSAANTAYLPFFFSEAAREDTERHVFGRAGAMYAAVLGAACLGGILFSKEIVAIVATEEYSGAYRPMGLLFASAYLFALYSIIVLPVMYLKKTLYLPLLMGASGALNVGLCFALVPSMGVDGAAVASVTSTAILFFSAYLLARGLYRIVYGNLFWVAFFAVSAVSAGAYFIDSGLAARAAVFGVMAPALLLPVLWAWRESSREGISGTEKRPLRILFVPFFFYIQYPVFAPVIRRLRQMGYEPVLLNVPNATGLDETGQYNPLMFERDGVPFMGFRLSRFPRLMKLWIVGPIAHVLQYFSNRSKVRAMANSLGPDVIVVGSHLGGMYIRYLQVLCSERGIPVVSIWMTADTLNEKISRIDRVLSSVMGFRDVLEWANYNEFMGRHHFLAATGLIRRHMTSIGIPGEQISVTGIPQQDAIHAMSLRPREDVRREVLEALGLSPEGRYVVLLTEKIQMVLGEEYAPVLAEGFARCVEALPDDVTAVVRFHPGEPPHIREMITSRLKGMRVAHDPGLDLAVVLYGAEAVVGHYSAAMYTAAFAGTPCATVNTTPNAAYSFFGEEDMARYESETFEALAVLLGRMASDAGFRQRASEDIKRWCERALASPLDGRATERIAEEIVSTVTERRPRG